MKLLQCNIWGGRLSQQILDLLIKEDADIVCFQEIISANGQLAFFPIMEEFQDKAGYSHGFLAPMMSFSFMHKTARFGNAILSRFPLIEQNITYTNLKHVEDFDFDLHDYNTRNLQHAVLEIEGSKLHILNHHGYHIPGHKNGNQKTMSQMQQIGEYIDKLKGPVILTGDFNLSPQSKSLDLINSRLINLSMNHNLTTTRNVLTHKTEVCDYIFVNEQIKVNGFKASEEIVSDHKALILEFDIA